MKTDFAILIIFCNARFAFQSTFVLIKPRKPETLFWATALQFFYTSQLYYKCHWYTSQCKSMTWNIYEHFQNILSCAFWFSLPQNCYLFVGVLLVSSDLSMITNYKMFKTKKILPGGNSVREYFHKYKSYSRCVAKLCPSDKFRLFHR